ncbi:MAG: SAM-dependent methyltransferase, partial [Candidatus Paracaedibacteraceae bacterium]|nr:SAM-dependent methyltransferase [Candidatus Paracaedibacteraceae bacterium]
AIYKHRHVGIFEYPGKADISVHVNFKNIALQCNKRGLQYNIQTQRQFLLDFGIQLRLEQICSQVDNVQASLICQGVDRLIDPSKMGQLFKVLHIEK